MVTISRVPVRSSSQINGIESEDVWSYFWSAVAIVTIYSVLHVCARLMASPNLGEDDPLINLYTQHLALGYGSDEPPLFTWLIYGVQLLTGPYLISFQLVKYGLLIATVGVLFWCAYAVTGRAVWSLIVAEALTLIYHVGWRFHEGFAGLIPAMFCSVLALLFILRIIERQRFGDFAGLGLACGLGLLSQYSFAIGLGAFIVAALAVKEIRSRLFCAKLLVSAGLCLASIAPHIVWIMDDPHRLSAFMSAPAHTDLWRVVKKTLAAPFLFYWSLLLFLLIAAAVRLAVTRRLEIVPETGWQWSPQLRFLGWYFIAVHALLFTTGIAFSHVLYASHDLLSTMVPTLILVFALIFQAEQTPADLRRWALISLCVIAFAFAARSANMFVMEPFCKLCRWGIPYDLLARELKSAGFERGRIVGLEEDLAGNLRMYFPASDISYRNPARLDSAWSQTLAAGPYAIVWQVGGKHGLKVSRETLRQRLAAAGLQGPIKIFQAPWRHILRETGYRQTEWNYVISTKPQGG